MNLTISDHPSPADLHAFGLGRLDEHSREQIERHVENCDSCCQVLRSTPDDTLLARMRGTAETMQFSSGTAAGAEPSVEVSVEGAIPRDLAEHPRYRVLRLIGAGGMGVVFQAEHKLMERPVALKVMSRKYTDNSRAVERFRQEVKAAAKLSHKNIVAAHDAEQAGDLHFLVMEHVDGVGLDQYVKQRGPLSVHDACNIVTQAAHGLQHAFEHGMVHRDIKPHNLMLSRKGRVKILDFGLARLAAEHAAEEAADLHGGTASGLTMDGTILGTPDYIAPEQVSDSHAADIRADLYSLGCTLYFLLTGQPPFPEESIRRKLVAHRTREPRGLTEFRRDVPAELEQVLRKLTAKDPAARYQTPKELCDALAPFLKEGEKPKGRSTVLEPIGDWDTLVTLADEAQCCPTAESTSGVSSCGSQVVCSPSGAARFVMPAINTQGRSRRSWLKQWKKHLIAGAAGLVVVISAIVMLNSGDDGEDEGGTPGQRPGDLVIAKTDGTPDQGLPRELPPGGARSVSPKLGGFNGPGGEFPVPGGSGGFPPSPGGSPFYAEPGAAPGTPFSLPGSRGDWPEDRIVDVKGLDQVLVLLPQRGHYHPDLQLVQNVFDAQDRWRLTLASSQKGAVQAADGTRVEAEWGFTDIKPVKCAAVVFIGTLDDKANEFIGDQRVKRLIDKMLEEGRIVAAVCNGTKVPASLGFYRERTVTGFDRQFLEHSGAQYVADEAVVDDGLLLTGKDQNAAEAFARRLLERLDEGSPALDSSPDSSPDASQSVTPPG